MEIKILQENFNKALSYTSRFVSSKATLPVLTNIKLQSKGSKLFLQATNLESSISTSIGAKVAIEGSICVNARFLADLVSQLPKGTLSLLAENEKLSLVADNFTSTVAGMNSADFPAVPETISAQSVVVNAKVLIASLGVTLFAVSHDESRPILTGLLFILKGQSLILVGTDGHRLSQRKIKTSYKGEDKKVILPRGVVSEIARIASSEENVAIDLQSGDNNAVFGIGESVLTSRIIEGEFPNFEKIIPSQSSVTIRVSKDQLLQAVKVSSVFTRGEGTMGKLVVSESSISLESESQRNGKQKFDVEAKVEGTPLEVMFNLKFIEDFLQVIAGEEITIKLADATSPAIFLDSTDTDFLHLIMPLKL